MKIYLYILLIISFTCPFNCSSQVSDDSLKKIFTDQYTRDNSANYCLFGPTEPEFSEMNELFEGYFKDTRLYIVLFRSAKQLVGGPNCFPALYAVNIFNGKVVSFKNNETFYEFINKADKPITRLDKAYLYLYLCKKVFQWGSFQVSALHEFPQETHHSSIFASNKSTQALFLKRYCFITHDGPDVSANGMTIFSSGNCDTGSLRYHFSFDEYDKLTAIAVDKIH